MLAVSLLLGHRRSIDLATSKFLASRQWIVNLMIGVSGATAPAHVMGLQGDLARLKSLDLVAESGVTGLPRRLHSATLVLTNPFPKGVAASLRLIANLMCARIGANVQLLVEVDRRGELEK